MAEIQEKLHSEIVGLRGELKDVNKNITKIAVLSTKVEAHEKSIDKLETSVDKIKWRENVADTITGLWLATLTAIGLVPK